LLNGPAVQSPLRRSGGIEPIVALSCVDNGNQLLSQCDGGLCLWDVQDLNVSESIDHYPDFSVEDSRTGGFFTGDNDGEGGWKIRFVSPSGDSRLILSATSGKLRALKYAEAMNQLAYVTLDKISMVDVATGSIIWSVDATEADHVCLAFAKDNRLLGLVTSQASSGSASNPGSADLRTEIHFVVLDANTGEKRGEAKRQGQSPIGDIIGVLDSSNPLFITVTNNGILEEWTSDLSVLKTSSLLEDTGRFATSRARLFASRSGLLGVAVGSSIGLFDTKLNPQQSLRKLDKTIDALAISPDDQFYAIIAHSSRIGAGSEPTVMRVYDMRGGLIAERTLFKDSSSDAPLYFGDSIIETLQSDGLISWSMGPDSLLKAAEKRLVYYRNQQKRLELERLADKAFKEHRYRDAIKLFQEAIDIDPINSDQHALLGNSFVFGAETAGDWEAADRAYSAGIAVQPYDSILFLQRGKERFRAGRFAEAEEDFSSGLKHHQFFLPVVRVIAGFLGLNKGIHNLSITLVMQGAGEFHLRRAMARFAQKKWTSVISDINAIQQVNLDVDKYQKKYWPEAYKGEPRELLPIYLHYRGRAAFHLGRYEDAYRDLRSAADRMRHDDVEYAYDDLELPNSAGVREATRGDMLAVAAQAAQLSGNVQSATDALAEARSAFAAAISRAPNSQIWNEALAALPQ